MKLGLLRRVGVCVVTVMVGATFAGATASAAPEAERPPFYEPPAELPANNGDIVRAEPSEYFLDPIKAIKVDADVQRVMYRSSDRDGTPIAATGTVIVPNTPWEGDGQRPVVAYAPGTQGLADDCAPSIQLANGTEYEGLFIKAMIAKGYAVTMTDYQGLGTPGPHTYVNREVSGHAVLDSVRAAQRLTEVDVPEAGPAALFGYSQGGGASASAAELASSYAPELDIKGAASGAVPAELGGLADNLDGGLYSAFLGYSVAGLAGGYDIDVGDYLNDKGMDYLGEAGKKCTIEAVATLGFRNTKDFTKDGRPISDYLGEAPFKDIVDEQQIGRSKPEFPVLLSHSRLDDVIPYEQGTTLDEQWCAQGADVQFAPNLGPTHIGGAVASFPRVFGWLDDRFNGEPSTPNCGSALQTPPDPEVKYDQDKPLLPQLSGRLIHQEG